LTTTQVCCMLNYDSSILHVELRLKYITCWTTTQVYYMLNYDSSILHVELRLKYITCWTTTQVYYMLNYDSSILHVELRLKYTCWTVMEHQQIPRITVTKLSSTSFVLTHSSKSSNQNTVFIRYDVLIFRVLEYKEYKTHTGKFYECKAWLVEEKKLNSLYVVPISGYTGSKFVT
jgi:hypothetical protein